MPTTDRPTTVTLKGPLWSAEATLLQQVSEQNRPAFQTLFLDLPAQEQTNAALTSGVLIALCVVTQVTVHPTPNVNCVWEQEGELPTEKLSPEHLNRWRQQGQVSLVLLRPESVADPAQPPTLETFICLAGEIRLDYLTPKSIARTKLFSALPLQIVSDAATRLENRSGASRLAGEITVHSSGVSIYGEVHLPWDAEDRWIAAPFRMTSLPLTQYFSPNNANFLASTGRHISLEQERFTETEKQDWIATWQRFSQQLNPRHPLQRGNRRGDDSTPVPNWVTLEVTNPRAVPHLYWLIEGATSTLKFGKEELHLLLSDRPPYDPDHPPTSLARILLSEVEVEPNDQGITITARANVVTDGDLEPSTASGALHYAYELTNGDLFQETFTAVGLKTAFSPVETPQFLRQAQNLPTPEWTSGAQAQPIEPAVIWGFMPLENGWIQLPIPNLTEQIYLDSGLENSPFSESDGAKTVDQSLPSLLQGAVSLGNDRPEVQQDYPQEQPWSLTLTGAKAILGTWTLTRSDSALKLSAIEMTLTAPDMVLNGFFWLSTGQPRLEDALPDLDDWSTGLRSLPLQVIREADLFPAPIFLEWETLEIGTRSEPGDLPPAFLQNWKFAYAVDSATFRRLVNADVLPVTLFQDFRPWLWQRHAHLPMVQALPLTQNRVPANYPSASRQLVPYELPTTVEDELPLPKGWWFAVSNGQGAAAWPEFVATPELVVEPADSWREKFDLPLVCLSLPGLVLDPQGNGNIAVDASLKLPLQYRFDLPYTDEVNALAQLPQDPAEPEHVSPRPNSTPPETLQPLNRETFEDHWQRLSTLASLAAVDGVEALTVQTTNGNGNQTAIQYLIEPYQWPVQLEFHLQTYPGTLTLQHGSDIAITGNSALAGLSGQFSLAADQLLTTTETTDSYTITAGSMAAHGESLAIDTDQRGLRDQRGLTRYATRFSGADLLMTRVDFQASPVTQQTYDLITTLKRQPLQVGSHTWQLWFRDLPLETTATEGDAYFSRLTVHSDALQDINDPEARSRDHDFRAGYEWRLAATEDAKTYMELFNLHFYPLTLDEVELVAGQVQTVSLSGRLQLPLSNAQELTDFSNAVQITFIRGAEGLQLQDITRKGSDGSAGAGEWPLALAKGETTDAPLLTWSGIQLNTDKTQVLLEQPQIQFFLFNQKWCIDLDAQEVRQSLAGTKSQFSHLFDSSDPDGGSLTAAALVISMDLAQGQHWVALNLDVRLGKNRGHNVESTAQRSAFAAKVCLPILGEPVLNDSLSITKPYWCSGVLFNDLNLDIREDAFSINDQAMQFEWQTSEIANSNQANAPLQLLPGLELVSDSGLNGSSTLERSTEGAAEQQTRTLKVPGFAALTFEAIPSFGGMPELQLKTAVVEVMLFCRWGEALQQAVTPQIPSLRQVFGSSAGDLVCGYTTQLLKADSLTVEQAAQTWTETLLLNGVLEVKNLVSWPQDMTVTTTEDGNTWATLPARQTATGSTKLLHHHRHTLRILFNQHSVPEHLLVEGPGNLLFQLRDDAIWNFEAVVEHQLVDVNLDEKGVTPLSLNCDRRWTTVQPVHWLTPQSFKQALLHLKETMAANANAESRSAEDLAGGYLSPQLLKQLAEDDDAVLNQLAQQADQMLLIEASAHHWIHQTALQGKSTTTLQFLPNGSQHGVLSSPDDYRPSNPDDPQWLLLAMPFLGRLQAPEYDRLTGLATPEGAIPGILPLQSDPILYLASGLPEPTLSLTLASWGDRQRVEILISGLDTAVGRTWDRLDSLSLEANWFRLQHPFPETVPQGLQSVFAALPDTTARLSRPTALRRAIDPAGDSRLSLQTTANPDPDPPNFLQGWLWPPRSLWMIPPLDYEEGLQVLYTFQEGNGNLVYDVTDGTAPQQGLNLQLQYPDTTSWSRPGGGLSINKPSVIRSKRPATQLSQGCKTTGEITVEAWIKPASETLNDRGPARIVTLSPDTSNRNFTLGQGPGSSQAKYQYVAENTYLIRLRTSQTDNNATDYRPQRRRQETWPELYVITPPIKAEEEQHVVFTRDRAGIARVYINGEPALVGLVSSEEVRENATAVELAGDFSTWDDNFHLSLGNEYSFDPNAKAKDSDDKHPRSWLGTYYQVAIFSRALNAGEVSKRFQQGHAASPQRSPSYSLMAPGVQFISSALAGFEGTAPLAQMAQGEPTRYVAATVLPAALHPQTLHPDSLAVSPYLSVEFRPAASADLYELQLVSTELLCLDPVKQTLLPVASHLWENTTDLASISLDWARQTHQRLCPNSPVAILRSRQVQRLKSTREDKSAVDTVATVITTYSFAIVTGLALTSSLAKRMFRLRSSVQQLYFQEGNCGSYQLPPEHLQPFELAPPQTTGVQPLYLTQRPVLKEADYPPHSWPWGLSALRLSVQYAADGQGILGTLASNETASEDKASTFTLWWQAFQHQVQYRTATVETDNRPRAGLPQWFRAPAIGSFLPVTPTPPMPNSTSIQALELGINNPLQNWQAVLPGQMRYLLVGNRPGAIQAIRNQILRQSYQAGEALTPANVLVSGSIPVQHRMPRPVPLPANTSTNHSKALQPWASYFSPDQNALVTDAPADEAFFGSGTNRPARRLQMRLLEPARGAVSSQWNGELIFEIQAGIDSQKISETFSNNWDCEITLTDASESIPYGKGTTFDHPSRYRFQLTRPDQLQPFLARQPVGKFLSIQAKVKPAGEDNGFHQTLAFALRLIDKNQLRLPLQPYFIHFEDPEYNRKLASPSAHDLKPVRVVPVPQKEQQTEARLIPIKLSADRREYNPDSVLSLRYDWTEPEVIPENTFAITLEFHRLSANGVRTELRLLEEISTLAAATLQQISLLDLIPAGFGNSTTNSSDTVEPSLRPGDVLEVALKVKEGVDERATALLNLNIVAESVTPAPEAAYALLRSHAFESRTECVRFAWGAIATHIQMINADDLLSEVVRRRAVFQWSDSVRPTTLKQYAIQKITQTGSTHFPLSSQTQES